MSTNRGRRVHRRNDRDSLKADKVEVFVIESLVAHKLLQERNQLYGVVLVRLGQIDIFQVDDESLDLLRPVDSTVGIGGLRAHLVQLLNNVEGRSLSVAVDDGHLCGLHLLDQRADDQVFSAALRTHQNKAFVSIEKRLDKRDVLLDRGRHEERWRLGVLNVVDVESSGVLLDKSGPLLLLGIEGIQKNISGVGHFLLGML